MIIGLTGYAQSGKDTVAKILVNQYGYKRVAFADKIRELLLEVNPIMYNGGRLSVLVDNFGWDVAKAQPEVRRLLQDLGVGARKLFGDGFWIKQALAPKLTHQNIVVTDVRFINEAEMIQHLDGQIWRIKRLGVAAVNDHVSESEMDDYKVDQIFVNNGTLDDLEHLIKVRMANDLYRNITSLST
jgi:hypothetical protein